MDPLQRPALSGKGGPQRSALFLLSALALVAPLLLGGCITLKPVSHHASGEAVVIADMPVRAWGDNTCGAGALATVLNHYGDPATEDELIRSFPKGRNGGVISIDVLLKARSEGFRANLTRGSEEMVRSALMNRQPVILMLQVVDLPGQNRDLYHYIVLDGIDPATGLVRMQFGDAKSRWAELSSIEKPWRSTEYATLLVTPKTAEERAYDQALGAAVSLEQNGKTSEAAAAYRSLIETHPQDSQLWINLGNALSTLRDGSGAEAAYRKAVELRPDDRDALNNLAWLLFDSGRAAEAEPFARRAVEAIGGDSDLVYDTLGEILASRSDCAGATQAFTRALETVPAERASSRPALLLKLGEQQEACGRRTEAQSTFSRALESEPDQDTRAKIESALRNVSG